MKQLLLSLACFVLLGLSGGTATAQTVTCNQYVTAGQSTSCTSSTATTWSLSGGGSISSTGPTTSITYTAPTGIVAQHVELGCPITPNDSIFNTRIDNLPADPNSAVKLNNTEPTTPVGNVSSGSNVISQVSSTVGVQDGMTITGTYIPTGSTVSSFTANTASSAPWNGSITISQNATGTATGETLTVLGAGAYGIHFDGGTWGHGYADSTTPTQAITGYYGGYDSAFPVINGFNSYREGGQDVGITGWFVNNLDGANQDQGEGIINRSTCVEHDSYDRYLNGVIKGGTYGAQGVSTEDLNGYVPVSFGTDAAGLPDAATMWSATEIRTGIKHAGRVNINAFFFTAGAGTGGPGSGSLFMWPATAAATNGASTNVTYATDKSSTSHITYGDRIKLNSGFASSGTCWNSGTNSTTSCSEATICASPLTATQIGYCQNIMTAMMQYGFFFSDGTSGGDNWAINVDASATGDHDIMAAFNAIGNAKVLPQSNFTVVNERSLMWNPNTYQVTPNGKTSWVAGTYGGVNYSLDTALTQSYETPVNQVVITGGSTPVIVGIDPVTVGTSLTQGKLIVAVGSTLNLSGLAWVNPSTLSQTLVWSVSGTGCGSVSGSTYTAPTSGSSEVTGCSLTATASVDTAATTNVSFTVVPLGSDGGLRIDTDNYTTTNTDGNGNTWYQDTGIMGLTSAASPYPAMTGTYANQMTTISYYNGSSDARYQFVMPSGNYKIHWLFGEGDCSGATWPNSTYTWSNRDILELWANNNIVDHVYSWSKPIGFACDTEADAYIPTTTTSAGLISAMVSSVAPDINCPSSVSNNSGCGTPFTGSNWKGANLAPINGSVSQNQAVFVGGVEVIPDTADSAHLAIDLTSQPCNTWPTTTYYNTNNSTTVTTATTGCTGGSVNYACGTTSIRNNQICGGQTLMPIYPQDWFTGVNLANTAWGVSGLGANVSSCPGTSGALTCSVNSDGSVNVSLASGTYANNQPITLTATNSSYSATTTLYTVGSLTAVNPVPQVNHYAYVRSLTVSHTKVSSGVTSMPVLVSLTLPSLKSVALGGHMSNASCYDAAFASNSSGTPTLIPWEVEKCDTTNGILIAHVLAPVSSTTDTPFYLYYGNSYINWQINTPSQVWDSNFKGVYHFKLVNPSKTAASPDSTSNSNTLGTINSFYPTNTATFDGTPAANGFTVNAYFSMNPQILASSAGTIEGWLNTPTAQSGNSYGAMGLYDGSNGFYWGDQSNYYGGMLFGWSTGGQFTDTQVSLGTNVWHYVVYTWSGSGQALYEDGVPLTEPTNSANHTPPGAATVFTPSGSAVLALGTPPPNDSYNWPGSMDEIRVSNIARPAAYVASTYNSYGSPSTFIAVGAETAN